MIEDIIRSSRRSDGACSESTEQRWREKTGMSDRVENIGALNGTAFLACHVRPVSMLAPFTIRSTEAVTSASSIGLSSVRAISSPENLKLSGSKWLRMAPSLNFVIHVSSGISLSRKMRRVDPRASPCTERPPG